MYTSRMAVAVDAASLARLVDIARAAGEAVMAHYGTADARAKDDGSPLTAADLAAHELICAALRAWDPDLPIVSEEADVPPMGTRRGWTRFWLVDPLDGTKEFLARNGEFTVNIALIDGGAPVLGVVGAPALGRIYYGGKGLGSWRLLGDGPAEPLRSAPAPEGTPVRVVGSRSHGGDADLAMLGGRAVGARVSMGSSLKFCCLAEGTADVYPRSGPIMEWDVAAGDCVFRWSGADGPRLSPLRYNGDEMRLHGFVVGL